MRWLPLIKTNLFAACSSFTQKLIALCFKQYFVYFTDWKSVLASKLSGEGIANSYLNNNGLNCLVW